MLNSTLIQRLNSSLTQWSPRVLSVLRFVTGLLFLEHGTSKLFALPHNPNFDNLPSLLVVAGCLELAGGALVSVGLFTRLAAFILSGEMAFAYWMAHAPKHMLPVANGGDPAILYCFIFFYLIFAGGGEWSVDALMGRSRSPAHA